MAVVGALDLDTMSRPVLARIRRIASSVASVPEFVNRHSGSLKRSAGSPPPRQDPRGLREVRAAAAARLIASTIVGFACPITIAP